MAAPPVRKASVRNGSSPAFLFALVVAAAAILLGAAVLTVRLAGDTAIIESLRAPVMVKPNAAIGFMLAGLALAALTGRETTAAARLLGLALVAGGGATLSQDLLDIDLGIDEFFMRDMPDAGLTASPGRMSPLSAATFAMLGAGFLLARRGSAWSNLASVLFALVAVQALLIIVSYVYGVPALYHPFPYTAISSYAAVMFLLLAAGGFAAMPERGLAAAVIDRSMAGQMVRGLLPWIVIIPVALGWLQHRGVLVGYYDSAVSSALFAVSMILLLALVVWLTAAELRRSDFDRQQALTQLHGEREWLKTTLASIADGVIVTDANGMVLSMNGVAEELIGCPNDLAVGRPIWEVFRTVDEESGETVDSSALVALREHQRVNNALHLLVTHDGKEVPIEDSGAPIIGPGRLVAGVVLIFRDITGRRRAEERQALLVRELNHRVRNVLMIVLSLVQASARHATNEQAGEMARVLAERLRSLSRAHELLLDSQWSGASLRALVGRELEPFRTDGTDTIVITGPDVLLPPQCTSILAMVLHELTTNAVKYGALLSAEGRLNVSWRVRGSRLTLKWIESGVSAPAERGQAGFGTQLVEQGVRQNLGGDAEVEFSDDGLKVEIGFSLDHGVADDRPLQAHS